MRNPEANVGLAVLICLVFHLIPGTGHATTYYVDNNHPSAGDNNPGTIDLPWLTIQHASEVMEAGDMTYIREGSYNEHVYVEQGGNGTAGHIVFSAYPGETPILDGTGVTDSQNGIIVAQSYIKLLGLEIRNWQDNAIWVENAAYFEISDCLIHDVYYGVGIADGSHDFEINRVEAHHFMSYGFDVSPSGGSACYNGTFNDCVAHTASDPQQNVDGYAIGHGTQHDFVFNRCETYGVFDGFDIGENQGGSQTNALLNRCSAHDCWNGGFKLWGHQVTLVNCLAYHNGTANIELDWGGNPGTTTLHSCTIMDSETFNIWIENSNDTLHMYNCILAGGDNIGLAFEQQDASNYFGDYNIFHNNDSDRAIVVGYEDEFSLDQIASGDWTAYSGQDANSLVVYSVSDLFTDPGSFDLHLFETSTAVDNGTSTGAPADDFDGNPRPAGQGYDIGAFEYQFGVGTDGEKPEDVHLGEIRLRTFPTPFDHTAIISYSLPQPGVAELGIYDLAGRRVRSLVLGPQPAGDGQAAWDGRDDAGKKSPDGLYLCRLESHGISTSSHLVLTR